LIVSVLAALAGCSSGLDGGAEATGSDLRSDAPTKASLGAKIFADTNLSEPAGQACATCHDPAHGFADPRPGTTSEGAIAGRFGVRNSPSMAYASFIPPLLPGGDETGYGGGMFWDGRVSTLQQQAVGPLLNPLEMNNPDKASIQRKLQAADYAAEFTAVFGDGALSDPDKALANLAEAIAAFETTGIPHRFTSKYDGLLAGKTTLTDAEQRGLTLFEDRKTGPCTPPNDAPPCGCAQCHLDKPQANGSPPLFTDFGYDNIGIPRNTTNPFYQLPPNLNPGGANFIDNGLGSVVHNPRQFGHFKAPSLRNVALTAPYGHNGYFPDLKSIVHFYNTRDVRGEWPAPEQAFNMNLTGLGDLGLTSAEEDDIVAFLGTLTDGYMARAR
jgi:cytochrome c peroxidase